MRNLRHNDDDVIADVFNENRYAKPEVDPLEEMAVALGDIKDKLAGFSIPMNLGPAPGGPAPPPADMPKPEVDGEKVADLLNKLNDIVNQLRLYMPNAEPKKGCGCGNPGCGGGH